MLTGVIMESAVQGFLYLLPGFVAALTYRSLTVRTHANNFEQMVQAIIFTAVIQELLKFLFEETGPLELVGAGVLFGGVVGFVMDRDFVHNFLRWLKVTRKSGYPSEWFSAFSGGEDAWVMLHFNDECSLFGWAREWPSHPEKGHFLIEEGVWYKGLESDYERASEALGPLLIPASDVSMVEFIGHD